MLSARAPNAGYVEIPTRSGLQGALDKLISVDKLADHHRFDRRVQALALSVCGNAGSGSDAQVRAIEEFCAALPYRREPADIFREPLQVAGLLPGPPGMAWPKGGDCDDIVLLALALLRALSIPCEGQLFCDADGEAFHIRAVAYLPPGQPRYAYVFDPVFLSEAQWHLAHQGGKPNLAANKLTSAATALARPGRLAGEPEAAQSSPWPTAAALLTWGLAAAALYYVATPPSRKRR